MTIIARVDSGLALMLHNHLGIQVQCRLFSTFTLAYSVVPQSKPSNIKRKEYPKRRYQKSI